MYFLFDIGGTRMRFSFSSDGVEIGDVEVVETPKTYLEALESVDKYYKLYARQGGIDKISGGLAGVLDADKRTVLDCYNLPDWKQKNFAQDLEKKYNCQVFLENDAALEGLGEAVKGAGKGARIVAYITVGTGLGGARIVDQMIDKKNIGFEPGHQIVNFSNSSDLGDLVSGAGIEARIGYPPEKIEDNSIWEENLNILAVGLHNTIVHWSPDIVVLGGGLIMQDKYDIHNLNAKLHEISKGYPLLPPLVKASLGQSSGIIGALRLANV